MKPKHSYLLIVNPEAGSHQTLKALPIIEKRLRKENIQFEFHFTSEPNHAIEIVRQYGNNYDVIVSVGGDGTINEVVNGMLDIDKPLGMIPVGTGNDFARSCIIPHDNISKALDILLAHDIKLIDVGQVNEKRFVNVMGVGYEGRTNDIGKKLKFIKGSFRYILAIAYVFLTYRRIPMRITFNNKVIDEPNFLISLGNGWNVGGGVKLTPNAKLDDGLIDICLIRDVARSQIAINLNRLYDGTMHVLPEVEMFQTSKMTIESDQIIPMHFDGESLGPTKKLEISLHPKSLAVIGDWSKDPR